MSRFICLPPFLANSRTAVFALDTAHVFVFITSVAAELIIAGAVIDAGKGNVARLMALVLAVEAW